MKREEVARILEAEKPEMHRRFGVLSVALFGSVARNEATALSDVDLIVEFEKPVGYFTLFALQDHLEERLGCHVDLGTAVSLKPRLRERVLSELVDVA